MQFFELDPIYKQRVALIAEDGGSISYAELFAQADCIAASLKARTLAFLFCRNDPASLAAYLGMLRSQTVPLLLSQSIPQDQLDSLISCYRPQVLFLPTCYSFQNSSYQCTRQFGEYIIYQSIAEPDYALDPDLALLLTTSGSTGSPKLVRQSYKNLAANTASIVEYLKLTADSRLITTLPMYYTYGLSMLQTHLAVGATIILNEAGIMGKKFWTQAKAQRATTFGGVPYTYEMLKKLRFQHMELPDLRVLTQAGGRLNPERVQEFAEICESKGMEFIVMYGAAEATARMAYLPFAEVKRRPGSIGLAVPGGVFSLEDREGQVISQAETIGELVYLGHNVTMGYAENRFDLALGDENHGVLRTGDMAKRDLDGFYYIVGRKNRFLKIYGNRVNLVEVEDILHQGGYDCVCAGKDDCLDIYLTNPQGKEPVCAFLSAKIGLNQAAFVEHIIERIPRNAAGKVLYGELEAMRGRSDER